MANESPRRAGAEGATAPETLRQKDRKGARALWKAGGTGRRNLDRSRLTEEVDRRIRGSGREPANLSGPRTEGARRRAERGAATVAKLSKDP
jgi:hypothetical protein